MVHAGMLPNIPENPRNRQGTKRGRKRLFNAVIQALRMRVERTFAWDDKYTYRSGKFVGQSEIAFSSGDE
jgi:hypothetical protein